MKKKTGKKGAPRAVTVTVDPRETGGRYVYTNQYHLDPEVVREGQDKTATYNFSPGMLVKIVSSPNSRARKGMHAVYQHPHEDGHCVRLEDGADIYAEKIIPL